MGLFAVETFDESSFTRFDMRDTYTNTKAQNESYQMTYAVKTVENLFTLCGHERYLMVMEIYQS